jgi:outer membrane protein
MKKSLLIIALAISIVSCNQKDKPATTAKEMKTAYVDTSKLLEEYTEAKDIESKYKAKSEAMGKELQSEINRFKADASNFQKTHKPTGKPGLRKMAPNYKEGNRSSAMHKMLCCSKSARKAEQKWIRL